MARSFHIHSLVCHQSLLPPGKSSCFCFSRWAVLIIIMPNLSLLYECVALDLPQNDEHEAESHVMHADNECWYHSQTVILDPIVPAWGWMIPPFALALFAIPITACKMDFLFNNLIDAASASHQCTSGGTRSIQVYLLSALAAYN